MHITPGIGFYWVSPQQAQIGLDTRRKVELATYNRAELQLIDMLTIPHTLSEIRRLAAKRGISEARLQDILEMLKENELLNEEKPAIADGLAWERLHRKLPTHREKIKISLPHLDQLGCSIAMYLAAAGINFLNSTDMQKIGEFDHFQLQAQFFGLPRTHGITTILRQINPHIAFSNKKDSEFLPDIVVLSGSHTLDPIVVGEYLARGVTCLQCWIEELDIYIGTLCSPHLGTCANCLYQHRRAVDQNWPKLVPQALHGRPVVPEMSSLQLAASLAGRELLNLIDFHTTQIRYAVWKIPPAPGKVQLISVPPHPECGCQPAHLNAQ